MGRITRPVALSPIFTKRANLQWGIVPYAREWCSETDPSILQRSRAPSQPLSRFSPTKHQDSHFREESLEKVTVLTFQRHSTSSTARNRWAHFAIGLQGVFKFALAAPMANYCELELSFISSEIGTLIPWYIGGSEPMQNDQTYFFSNIFFKFYNIVKIII